MGKGGGRGAASVWRGAVFVIQWVCSHLRPKPLAAWGGFGGVKRTHHCCMAKSSAFKKKNPISLCTKKPGTRSSATSSSILIRINLQKLTDSACDFLSVGLCHVFQRQPMNLDP
jgi:hypothetical protein